MQRDRAGNTLHERLGGAPVLAAVIDGFYGRVVASELLAPVFAQVDLERLRLHQAYFLGQVLGSAHADAGAMMRAAHQGLHVTPHQFDLMAAVLAESLRAARIGPGLIDEIMGHVAHLKDDIVGQ